MSGKLNPKTVEAARSPGLLHDGAGLYLQVTQNRKTEEIRKSWVFRYRSGGRTREMGLGPLATVSLSKARVAAAAARQLRADGHDPIERRNDQARQQHVAALRSKTFRQFAEEFIKDRESRHRNSKAAKQWPSTFARYVYPVFGDVPVEDVGVAEVKRVLEPIWNTKPVTAQRIRGRIEQALDAARSVGLRTGENPARLRGNLAFWFRPQRNSPKHHASVDYRQVANFFRDLRTRDGTAARALEFTILTAARTSEVIGATWAEIDLEDRTWTVPASRMKSGREHRVPLSMSAVTLLQNISGAHKVGDPIFVRPDGKKPLSNNAMLALLKRMGLKGKVTAHGFRSSFRTWFAEQKPTLDPAIAEVALAHATGSKVQQAYQRGDRLDQRREVMRDWDKYILPQPVKYDATIKKKRNLQL